MNLKEYLANDDPSKWYRLSSGEMKNLFDAAIEQFEHIAKEYAQLSIKHSDMQKVQVALVQYARRDGSQSNWVSMAAFDHREAAERYAVKCAEGNPPWVYRVVDAKHD